MKRIATFLLVIEVWCAPQLMVGCSEEHRVKADMAVGSNESKLVQESFDEGARAGGWRLRNWSMETFGGSTHPEGGLWDGWMWESPLFDMVPLRYFWIEVETRGVGTPFVSGMGFNRDAASGRYPHPDAVEGELIADDWTSWKTEAAEQANWVSRVYYTRARNNARQCGVRLMGDQVEFRNLKVETVDQAEVATWADTVYAQEMPPLNWSGTKRAETEVPAVLSKLKNGGLIRIVFLGDSIMNDTGNSTIDVLLERAFPGTRVEVITAVGGGTGAGLWLRDAETQWPKHDLDLKAAVIDMRPDLVCIGGISSGATWQEDMRVLATRIRLDIGSVTGAPPEILLMTGAFGKGKDLPEQSEQMRILAETMRWGFLDIREITEEYFREAQTKGYEREHFYRDAVHANHRGKQLLGRILLQFFEGN